MPPERQYHLYSPSPLPPRMFFLRRKGCGKGNDCENCSTFPESASRVRAERLAQQLLRDELTL